MKQSRLVVRNFLFYWLPAIFWAWFIFYLSQQQGLRTGLSIPKEILARKIAHVVEFGVLGWLIWRIFHLSLGTKLTFSMVASFLLAFFYAVMDEVHQSFVPNRSGKFADVLVDSLGIALFLFVVVQFYSGKVIKKFAFTALVVFFATIALIGFMVAQANKVMLERQAEKGIGFASSNFEADEEIIQKQASNQEQAEKNEAETSASREAERADSVQVNKDSQKLMQKMVLDVPFTSQAPFGVWDDVHEEACEEASLIMIKFFLDSKKLTPEIAEREIQKLKEYQIAKFGHYHDSTMEELVFIAEDFYGIKNLQVLYDFDRDDIKRELVKGNPVIVPTAGRELGNPNFKHPGPLYHNLVLRGFEGDVIITNDPGTRKGEGFKYSLDVIFSAVHDFPGEKEKILEGRKAMIVVR